MNIDGIEQEIDRIFRGYMGIKSFSGSEGKKKQLIICWKFSERRRTLKTILSSLADISFREILLADMQDMPWYCQKKKKGTNHCQLSVWFTIAMW